jgi:hypothetical protein
MLYREYQRGEIPVIEAERLVVVIPVKNHNELRLGRQIWNIAQKKHTALLLISVAENDDAYLYGQQCLVRLSAIIQSRWTPVKIKAFYKTKLISALNHVLQGGDALIYLEGDKVCEYVTSRKPFQELIRRLNISIHRINSSQNGNGF